MLLTHFAAVLVNRLGSKTLDLVILMVASRSFGMKAVGLVFFADTAAGIVLRTVDLGLFPVLLRRAARSEAGKGALRWATTVRSVGLALLTLALLPFLRAGFEQDAWLVAGFFVASGIYSVHEMSRAMLAGQQQFVVAAKVAVGSKLLEAAGTAAGAALGLGPLAWLVSRIAGQLVLATAAYHFAAARATEASSPAGLVMMREGIPFWLVRAVYALGHRIDLVIVTVWLGFDAAGVFGIAGRVLGAGLLLVTSLASAAMPPLVRDRRRFITRRETVTVLALSFLVGAGVLAGAPLIARIVTGAEDRELVNMVRLLAPCIALLSIEQPLETWLQAKYKERSLIGVSVLSLTSSAVALYLFVPLLGGLGAACAKLVTAAVEVIGVGVAVLVALRELRSPFVWILGRVPALSRRILANLTDRVDAIGRKLSDVPRVVACEVAGSSLHPDRFELGVSDIDYLVVTEEGAVGDAMGRCLPIARRYRYPGRVALEVADRRTLRWARQLGHPIHTHQPRRLIAGEHVHAPTEPESAREWGLSHAVFRLARLEWLALERSRGDGAVAAKLLQKGLDGVLRDLCPLGPPSLDRLADYGLEEPAFLREAVRRLKSSAMVPAMDATRVVAAAFDLVEQAYARETRTWQPGADSARPAPLWVERLALLLEPRIGALVGRVEPVTVHLTPTGPTRDDPMLIIGLGGEMEERVERLHKAAAVLVAQGPLPPPFRAYQWPVILPASVLSGDALVEHAPFFHVARADGGHTLYGTAPLGRMPPHGFIERAALRSTVHAMLRLPELVRAVESHRHTIDRVGGLLFARLPALSLAVDHGEIIVDPEHAVRRYVERYDDDLARLFGSDFSPERGVDLARRDRIAAALHAWLAGRTERLSTLLGGDEPAQSTVRREVAPSLG